MRTFSAIGLLILVGGCFPADLSGRTPAGDELRFLFYPGGEALDDLVIFEESNYFGKAQYQIDDPLADVGFRLNTGERVQAECVVIGEDILGDDECRRYEVYRSSWDKIPEGTHFDSPDLF